MNLKIVKIQNPWSHVHAACETSIIYSRMLPTTRPTWLFLFLQQPWFHECSTFNIESVYTGGHVTMVATREPVL